MPIAAAIAGALLGLLFVWASLAFFLNLMPDQPPPPEGSPMALFMGAFFPTGYLAAVKVCELLGGILVAIPRTRGLGLLVLGPIILNILFFHVFITRGAGLADPVLIAAVALSLFLLWAERRRFAGLVACRPCTAETRP